MSLPYNIKGFEATCCDFWLYINKTKLNCVGAVAEERHHCSQLGWVKYIESISPRGINKGKKSRHEHTLLFKTAFEFTSRHGKINVANKSIL